MKTFILAYYGQPHFKSVEEAKAHQILWMEWTKKLGSAVLQPGNPPTSYLNSKIEYKTHESWALQMGDNFGGGKSRDFKKVVDFFCVFGHFRGEGKANFSFFVEKNAGLNSKESLPNKFWAKLNILKFNPIFKVSN